jgi:hypothetical protein
VTFDSGRVINVIGTANGTPATGGSFQTDLFLTNYDNTFDHNPGLQTFSFLFNSATINVTEERVPLIRNRSHSFQQAVNPIGQSILIDGAIDLATPEAEGNSVEPAVRRDTTPNNKLPVTTPDVAIDVVPEPIKPDTLPENAAGPEDMNPAGDNNKDGALDLEMMAAGLGGWTIAKPRSGKETTLIDKKYFKKMHLREKAKRFARWNGSSLEGRDF